MVICACRWGGKLATFDELEILKAAETLADEIWQYVTKMPAFARDVLGGQLARAVDSVGANIAEAYGRFHYGEKIQFLYYARGSLFEAKYWIEYKRAILCQRQRDNDMQKDLTSSHAS